MNARLAKVVARAHQAQRVGFGDLRRLQRDVLPDGFMNREEVEALIGLDRHLVRADEDWVPFLAAATRVFVLERTAGPGDPEAAGWLVGVLNEVSARTAQVIAREVVQDCSAVDESLRRLARSVRRKKATAESTVEQTLLGAAAAAREGRSGPWRWHMPDSHLRAPRDHHEVAP